jgi:hypothetical protein
MAESIRKLKVFLCYASQDQIAARELYQRLSKEGWVAPWMAEEKLLPGMDWELEIRKTVKAADAVVVCLSNHSVTKEGYVQRELRLVLDAAEYKPEGTIFIIPLRLDDCLIPLRLERSQFIDFFPVRQKDLAYRRVRQSLALRANALGLPGIEPVNPPDAAEKSASATTDLRSPKEQRQTQKKTTDNKLPASSNPASVIHVHTGGGPYIAGDVNVTGDFVGRDKVDQSIEPAASPMPDESPKP